MNERYVIISVSSTINSGNQFKIPYTRVWSRWKFCIIPAIYLIAHQAICTFEFCWWTNYFLPSGFAAELGEIV